MVSIEIIVVDGGADRTRSWPPPRVPPVIAPVDAAQITPRGRGFRDIFLFLHADVTLPVAPRSSERPLPIPSL